MRPSSRSPQAGPNLEVKGHKSLWVLPGLLLLAAALALTWFIPSDTVELSVTPLKGEKPILVIELKPRERFTLHYYHSVEMAPIWEEHTVDENGRIYIEEERYLKFGAGMGRIPGRGKLKHRGPHEVIENMHWPTGDFVLRVASTHGVNHTIIWRGTKTNLSALVPGQAVIFSAKPLSLMQKWWRILKTHPATPNGASNDD